SRDGEGGISRVDQAVQRRERSRHLEAGRGLVHDRMGRGVAPQSLGELLLLGVAISIIHEMTGGEALGRRLGLRTMRSRESREQRSHRGDLLAPHVFWQAVL